MKTSFHLVISFLILGIFSMAAHPGSKKNPDPMLSKSNVNDSVLRHVVLFKFKEGTPAQKIEEIELAFAELQGKIPQIAGYEWGLNNSPEQLDKGFTHCFLLSFKSEEDRAIYLPHPDHKAFGALLGEHLADVLVVDYWSRQGP